MVRNVDQGGPGGLVPLGGERRGDLRHLRRELLPALADVDPRADDEKLRPARLPHRPMKVVIDTRIAE